MQFRPGEYIAHEYSFTNYIADDLEYAGLSHGPIISQFNNFATFQWKYRRNRVRAHFKERLLGAGLSQVGILEARAQDQRPSIPVGGACTASKGRTTKL